MDADGVLKILDFGTNMLSQQVGVSQFLVNKFSEHLCWLANWFYPIVIFSQMGCFTQHVVCHIISPQRCVSFCIWNFKFNLFLSLIFCNNITIYSLLSYLYIGENEHRLWGCEVWHLVMWCYSFFSIGWIFTLQM